jgi:hypothetical protein
VRALRSPDAPAEKKTHVSRTCTSPLTTQRSVKTVVESFKKMAKKFYKKWQKSFYKTIGKRFLQKN